MKNFGRIAILAALAGCLLAASARAQSAQTAQNPQDQNQNQSQYTGVSHPPPDDTIQADDSMTPAPAPKPSAAIPEKSAPPAPAPTQAPAAASGSHPFDNTDYGIVTKVPAPNSTAAGASLQKRAWNPDDDIVNYVPSNPHELGAGTNIYVRLSQPLSSTSTERGSAFQAVVAQNVYKGATVIIPSGSVLRGRVVSVSEGHHLGPHASMQLRPDVVILPDGTAYHLYAEAVQSLAPGTRTNQEGGIEAGSHYKKDAVEYGAGTGVAAVAGAAVAGPVGAGVGSLVGAGAVTAHMIMQHPQELTLPRGSSLVFSLTEPMDLTPTRN